MIKVKERENLKLENKCENLASSVKRLKAEKVKAEKDIKKKKVKTAEVSTNTTLSLS